MAALLTYEMARPKKSWSTSKNVSRWHRVLPPISMKVLWILRSSITKNATTAKTTASFVLDCGGQGVGERRLSRLLRRVKSGPVQKLVSFLRECGLRRSTNRCWSLIKAGAFDSLGGSRAQMMAGWKEPCRWGRLSRRIKPAVRDLFAGRIRTPKGRRQKFAGYSAWPNSRCFSMKKKCWFYVTAILSRHAND